MKAPIIVFPTECLFIDDDTLYAKIFAKNMEIKKGISIRSIAHYQELLEQNQNEFLFFKDNQNKNKILNSSKLSNDIRTVKSQLEGVISVVVADFHMHGTSGLELLSSIKSPFTYKILISNFIDIGYSQDITDAINDGSINAVLDKKRDLFTSLSHCILKGRNRFFSLLSNELASTLPRQGRLLDPEFSTFIWEAIDKNKPQHMWANQDLSLFRLENSQKNIRKNLYITTPDEVISLIESYQAEIAHPSVLQRIKSHNFMLAAEDPFSLDGSEWINYITPAKKFNGRLNEYIFSTIDEE